MLLNAFGGWKYDEYVGLAVARWRGLADDGSSRSLHSAK
jgi:hypothetical protein